MRFTIRHLLWFTLLAAVGCWWWLPSNSDAKAEFIGDFSSFEEPQRFATRESVSGIAAELIDECDIDYRRRDVVVMTLDTFGGKARLRSRGAGRLVLVLPSVELPNTCDVIFSVAKSARVIVVSETQANLIDGGVLLGLLSLATLSLWVTRRPGTSI